MASKKEVAAQIMEHLCTHDGDGGHGYTWGNRWGDGTTELLNIDGQTYRFAGGDRDCSSGVISAFEAAGIDCGGATYTGNMRQCMVGTGNFKWHPMSSGYVAKRADVYLNEGNHTAMCTSDVPDVLAQFSINEFGEVYGGKVGDQTGEESNIRGYYDYPWDGILECVVGGEATGQPVGTTSSGSNVDVRYRVHVQGGGWLDEMVNHTDTGGSGDDFAGEIGQAIDGIAIDMSGWYQVKTAEDGWLSAVRGYDINDDANGFAGELGHAVVAVRAYYETQAPGTTGWLAIEYQVANVGGSWFDVMHDDEDTGNSGDDFAGDGNPIDRFRARLIQC